MALWDRFKESASTMQTQLVAKKNDLKSGAFRDASMAMCALVAAADGKIDPSERQRVAQLIFSNEVLQNFPADDLQRCFDDNLNKLTADFDFGKVGVLQEIAKAKKKLSRGACRHPDRHRHRRRRRGLRRDGAGGRPRRLLRAGAAAARVRPLIRARA